MTRVTLLIFSGRPDPKWELPPQTAAELPHYLRESATGAGSSTLGYRGFLVESNDPGLPARVVIRGQPAAEQFLLDTGQGILPLEIRSVVADAIA